jgi:alpha-L-fucosidase
MADIGKWLSVNGEAIYGTKPWSVFGENADSAAYKSQQGFKPEEKDAVFDGTPKDVVQDIRFTTRGDILYIIARSWRQKEVPVKSLITNKYQIKSIKLVGYNDKVKWKQSTLDTKIEIPKQAIGKIPVYVFKVKLTENGELK